MWRQFSLFIPITLLLLGVFTLDSSAQMPAFPGAEGGAQNVTGGRGGNVFYVNSLLDTNTGDVAKKEGTLRWCLNQDGPRTILFKISGIIDLKSPLIITKGDVTIAGQTAPGDGICIRSFTTQIDADNVIIRFLRFRLGDEALQENDAISGRNHSNIMIDHCSMSWSVDACATFYSNKNFTLQWCLIAEALRNSVHEKGPHGYGGVWGGENASFHHNLLANNDSRNPRFNGWKRSGLKYETTIAEERVDFRNNVIYNWGGNNIYGGEAVGQYNMINNFFRYGPATKTKFRILQCYSDRDPQYGVPHGRFFLSGNYIHGNPTVTENNVKGVENMSNKAIEDVIKTVPFAFASVTTHPTEKVFEKVLAYVGCSYKRDTVDARLVNETRTGKFTFNGSNGSMNGLIDTQKDVGGWPEYKTTQAPLDTDLDGIPDEWEAASGLNPNLASDGLAKNLSPVGYTNLEVYLNSLVENIVTNQNLDGTLMSSNP